MKFTLEKTKQNQKPKPKTVCDRKVVWSYLIWKELLQVSGPELVRRKPRALESMLRQVSPGSEVPQSFSYGGNAVYTSAIK